MVKILQDYTTFYKIIYKILQNYLQNSLTLYTYLHIYTIGTYDTYQLHEELTRLRRNYSRSRVELFPVFPFLNVADDLPLRTPWRKSDTFFPMCLVTSVLLVRLTGSSSQSWIPRPSLNIMNSAN